MSSGLTIVIDAARTRSARVAASLAKLADVWNVAELDPAKTLCRELALVKIACLSGAQELPPSVATRNDVRVVHRDDRSMILEIVAEPKDVDDVIEALESSQLVELVRARQLTMWHGLTNPSIHEDGRRTATES